MNITKNYPLQVYGRTFQQRQADDGTDRRLQEACHDFEAVLLHQLLKTMRASVPKSGWLGQETGHQVFQDMLDGEYAKQMSRSGSFGLAGALYRQLSGK